METEQTNIKWEWQDVEENKPSPLLNNVDNVSLSEQIKRYTQDTKQRLFLAKWVVLTSSIWLGFVLLIVILVGSCVLILSDIVLNVLLATTTANVLGLAYIVLKGLFGNSNIKPLNNSIIK